MSHLKVNYGVEEEKIYIGSIPLIRLVPQGLEGRLPTIIFYHGLGSNKDNQRLRGYILASFGFQVFLPDALHHGERDAKFTEDPIMVSRYFWQAILQNLGESKRLINEIIEKYRGDGDRIIVSGHSMGGFTSAGVFTYNKNIRGVACLNGSFNWKASNDKLRIVHGHEGQEIEEEKEVNPLDPMINRSRLRDRDILILHGELDGDVDINPQREFFKLMKEESPKIEMIEYEGLGHFFTTNMMEDLIKWAKELVK